MYTYNNIYIFYNLFAYSTYKNYKIQSYSKFKLKIKSKIFFYFFINKKSTNCRIVMKIKNCKYGYK